MKKEAELRNTFRNRILARLSSADRRRVTNHLTSLDAVPRDSLYEPNKPFRYVYFPETAVASILTVLEDGTEGEVATIGNEGMVGLPVFLGAKRSPERSFWQVPGKAYRLPVKVFKKETNRNGTWNGNIKLYTQAFFTQMAQSVTCNRLHSMAKRCARWLLMTHDRVPGDEFELTQQFLAQMLGVRRTGVSEVAGTLQRGGLITYRRGHITILNRKGLEKASCECYRVVRREFERLLGPQANRK
jgi:CRP-like cAMP-binding protein